MVQQHDGFCRFITGTGRLTNHHTVLLVTFILQMVLLGKLAKPVCHPLIMMRRSRNLVQYLEEMIIELVLKLKQVKEACHGKHGLQIARQSTHKDLAAFWLGILQNAEEQAQTTG